MAVRNRPRDSLKFKDQLDCVHPLKLPVTFEKRVINKSKRPTCPHLALSPFALFFWCCE